MIDEFCIQLIRMWVNKVMLYSCGCMALAGGLQEGGGGGSRFNL